MTGVSPAAQRFIEFWRGDLAGDIAGHLTCSEVEELAELFVSLGDVETAQRWITYHGGSDDCDDQHCQCDECKQEGTQ